MFQIKKSRAAKAILLCLSLTVVEKGWVTKTHPFELGALVVTQEALYALTLAGSMLWRAFTNSNNSAVDRVLQQEIDRLTNRNCVPDVRSSAHAAQQPFSHRAAADQVKSIPIKPVPLVRVSSVPIQEISNVVDQARAIVSHITHDQVVQTTYAAIGETEKIASQELVRHIAIDWHKQIERTCGESIRFTRTNAYNQTQAQIQELNRGCTVETHPNGGVTLYTPNPIASLYLGPSRLQHTHTLADDIVEQRAYERIQITYDLDLRAAIRKELHAFVTNAYSLLYGTLIERIAALVYLTDFHIEGRTFGDPLYDVQREIYAKYAYTDGSLCIDRLSDMTDAHTIFKKYIAYQKKIAPFFEKQCVHARSRNADQLIKKARKVDLHVIRNNRTNQCYRKMLAAFAFGDMQQVEQIKNNNRTIPGIQTLYEQMCTAYNATIAQQEALLKDQYGILHFNLPDAQRDPLFAKQSEHDRAQLQSNPSALASFNDALLMRNRYKQALHKAWNISHEAEPAVHQALYALIDSGTIPERIDKIHEVSNNPQLKQSEQKAIVQALFLPNGIIKDFADYDSAQLLQMPAAILEEKHANTRQLLNHLVYAERVSADEQIQDKCAAAIECIQYAVAIADEEDPELYLSYAQDTYKQITAAIMLFNDQQQPADNQQNNNQPPSDSSKQPNKNKKNQEPPTNKNGPWLQKMTEEQWKKTLKYCCDKNNLDHWFCKNTAKHKFTQLLVKMNGDKIALVEAVLTRCIGKLPQDGFFEDIPIAVEEFIVTVNGIVVEGVIKLALYTSNNRYSMDWKKNL